MNLDTLIITLAFVTVAAELFTGTLALFFNKRLATELHAFSIKHGWKTPTVSRIRAMLVLLGLCMFCGGVYMVSTMWK